MILGPLLPPAIWPPPPSPWPTIVLKALHMVSMLILEPPRSLYIPIGGIRDYDVEKGLLETYYVFYRSLNKVILTYGLDDMDFCGNCFFGVSHTPPF